MVEPHHKIESLAKCDIIGCDETADRSFSVKRIEAAGMKLSDVKGGSAHLCKTHYRDFKKKMKKDRDLERLGW